jgi:ubiquinone/menaquinone biosynthesis C-methylase UbiE
LQRVNYDQIAHLYDAPDRGHDVDPNLVNFLEERDDLDPSTLSVLDVGCGTGKQVAANRSAFPAASIVGSDLFIGMLRVASENDPNAVWAQSDGSRLGFRDSAFDYITNQFSYAHIQDKPAFAAEIFRILKPGGRFVVTNIEPWSMDSWIMYQFFPAARELDHADFLQKDVFAELLTRTGFGSLRVDVDRKLKQEILGDFFSYASERHRASHFLAMSDNAYQSGLERLEEAIREHGPDKTITSESSRITQSADKPGNE